MRLSTLFVVMGVSAAARLARDAEEEMLCIEMGALSVTEDDVYSIAESIQGLLNSGRKGGCEHEKEFQKVEKFMVPYIKQLQKFDYDVSIWLVDMYQFQKSLYDFFLWLIESSPNGEVTGPIMAVAFSKKHMKQLQLASKKLAARTAELCERESSLLSSMETMLRKECDLYYIRMKKNLEKLSLDAGNHYKIAALAYSMFEGEVAYMQWSQDPSKNSEKSTYISRLLEFVEPPFATILSLTKNFNRQQFDNVILQFQPFMDAINSRCSMTEPMSIMEMTFKASRFYHRRITAERFSRLVSEDCVVEDMGAALIVKSVLDGKLESEVSEKLKVKVPAAQTAIVAKPQPVVSAIVDESWAEGAVERVAESLLGAVSGAQEEIVTLNSDYDVSSFVSLQTRTMQTHRQTHARLATAKERRTSFSAPASTENVTAVFRALSLDGLVAKGSDNMVVDAVARELVAEIAQQPSATAATKMLNAKVSDQRAILARLEKKLTDQRAAHIKSLDKISDTEASVTIYETQLLSFLPPPGVTMDAKVAKKWDRAIASHATAISSFNEVISSAIATVTSIVITGSELRAVSSSIRAIEHAISAVRNS